MQHLDLLWGFIGIGLALLAGKALRTVFTHLKKLYLPSSVLGGFIALLLGTQVLGVITNRITGTEISLVPEAVIQVWRGLPGLLINIVFAALLLGNRIPGIKEIWRKAGPQVAFGQTLAWGQYVVGITLGILILGPMLQLPAAAGALIEIGFEGGPGTAAGMADTFRELNFPEGADLALALATVGLVTGIVGGSILINWAIRRQHIPQPQSTESTAIPDADDVDEQHELAWIKTQEQQPTDPLSIHLAVVAVSVGIGWLLQTALRHIETITWARDGGTEIFRYVPLFPLAMIGGLIVQIIMDRTGWSQHINRRMMNRISGSALDFTIVAALGTLSLTAIRTHWQAFLLLAVGGMVWNVFALLVIAPRIIPEHWFQRGVCDFGQSTGVTVTGLLLLRMADPANESGTLESFGYKQLLFEPIVGGGLFTAASVPLLMRFGNLPILILTGTLCLFWLILGRIIYHRYR